MMVSKVYALFPINLISKDFQYHTIFEYFNIISWPDQELFLIPGTM